MTPWNWSLCYHFASEEEDLLQPKAPGLWKFNNFLLDDEDYTSEIGESLPVFKDKYADLDDLGLKWDLIKMEIRGFTIKYSKNQS